MTACWPAIARRKSWALRTSPETRSSGTPSIRPVSDVGRSRQRTRWPAACNCLTSTEPIKPLPPVTRMFRVRWTGVPSSSADGRSGETIAMRDLPGLRKTCASSPSVQSTPARHGPQASMRRQKRESSQSASRQRVDRSGWRRVSGPVRGDEFARILQDRLEQPHAASAIETIGDAFVERPADRPHEPGFEGVAGARHHRAPGQP